MQITSIPLILGSFAMVVLHPTDSIHESTFDSVYLLKYAPPNRRLSLGVGPVDSRVGVLVGRVHKDARAEQRRRQQRRLGGSDPEAAVPAPAVVVVGDGKQGTHSTRVIPFRCCGDGFYVG